MLKTRHLIIIAGPPCSGKSYLIQKIQYGKCRDLCEKIGLNRVDSWFYAQASDLMHLHEMDIESFLVLHYDIHGQYSKKKGFKRLQELIGNAAVVTILTLCSQLKVLIRYVNKRILLFLLLFFYGRTNYEFLRKAWNLRCLYKSGLFLPALYNNFFNFTDKFNNAVKFILNSGKSDCCALHPYDKNKAKIILQEYGGKETNNVLFK